MAELVAIALLLLSNNAPVKDHYNTWDEGGRGTSGQTGHCAINHAGRYVTSTRARNVHAEGQGEEFSHGGWESPFVGLRS
jgi:hypothetical protein